MNRSICLGFALATIFAIPEAAAEPNKEQYELQERCGKRAAEVFKSVFGGGGVTNTETGQNMRTYQNHFSVTFNKCFFLDIVTIVDYKTHNKGISTMMTLFDVNENKDYGTFYRDPKSMTPVACNVQTTICHTEGEWQALLKPYMEQ